MASKLIRFGILGSVALAAAVWGCAGDEKQTYVPDEEGPKYWESDVPRHEFDQNQIRRMQEQQPAQPERRRDEPQPPLRDDAPTTPDVDMDRAPIHHGTPPGTLPEGSPDTHERHEPDADRDVPRSSPEAPNPVREPTEIAPP